MLRFDPETTIDWEKRQITEVSIEFKHSGCEGTSIAVHENIALEGYVQLTMKASPIIAYAKEDTIEALTDAYITRLGSNWIMKSEAVLTRCGCGKSFGIKTGDERMDKIQLLRSKLSKSKKHHH